MSTEVLLTQVSESIKVVLDLTSRIDERVKMFSSQQQDLEKSMNNINSVINDVVLRVSLLEAKDYMSLKKETETLTQKVLIIESKGVDALDKRLQALELRIEGVGYGQKTVEERVRGIIDIAWKVLLPVIGALILWKLNLK